MKPLYGGPLIDQVLLLNRRQFEAAFIRNKMKMERKDEEKKIEERKK